MVNKETNEIMCLAGRKSLKRLNKEKGRGIAELPLSFLEMCKNALKEDAIKTAISHERQGESEGACAIAHYFKLTDEDLRDKS